MGFRVAELEVGRAAPCYAPHLEEAQASRLCVVRARCPELGEQLEDAPLWPIDSGRKGAGKIVDPSWALRNGHGVAALRYGVIGEHNYAFEDLIAAALPGRPLLELTTDRTRIALRLPRGPATRATAQLAELTLRARVALACIIQIESREDRAGVGVATVGCLPLVGASSFSKAAIRSSDVAP